MEASRKETIECNTQFYQTVNSDKRIYAIALVFPVNEKYHRDIPEIEWQIKQLWLLYYYYKQRIDGKNLKYNQIVIKYS